MAPWIMEKDDFKYTMSFGDDLFGGVLPYLCSLAPFLSHTAETGVGTLTQCIQSGDHSCVKTD
jgi:UDP-glucose 4-epimerase|eukprot:COSAG02_NODE_2802_length_8002_cov_11.765532_6_plen_63_part_00